ncbi:hypothetical protein [Pseudomonas sp. Leaf58]|uniref:hypothetical protein n=1 Tax=unclassified Pseudomonas TaxID=196821 RepID=UPI000A4C20BA|nr:hypothetical protein [Pseudomonas sp. Leaf58]
MSTEHSMIQLARELRTKFPFFESYQLNEHGAPTLDGASIFDMGLFLLILEEAGPAHSVALARLMSVTKLTIKNWIKKNQLDALAVIDSVGSGKTAHYILRNWGVYSENVYEPFRPYIRLVIKQWRLTEDGNS